MKQFLVSIITPLVVALLLSLFSGCQQPVPDVEASGSAKKVPGPILSKDHDGALYFDERYLDSLDKKPWSARTQREMAIHTQLSRLRVTKLGEEIVRAPSNDSVFERANGGRLVGYRNEAAYRADLYRKIDSLKVLEHLPLTPH